MFASWITVSFRNGSAWTTKGATSTVTTGSATWQQSFLNRKGLLHEIEEAFVPLQTLFDYLHQLDETRRVHESADVGGGLSGEMGNEYKKLTIFDVCCGKGYFTMLAAFILAKHENLLDHIESLVMLDKQSDIIWDHVAEANELFKMKMFHPSSDTPPLPLSVRTDCLKIEAWAGVNIFDESFTKILASRSGNSNIALIGIHLCRRLSSRFVELKNCFHPSIAISILAPCCVPIVGAISIRRRPLARARECDAHDQKKKIVNTGILFLGQKEEGGCWNCGNAAHTRETCTASKEVIKAHKKLCKAQKKRRIDGLEDETTDVGDKCLSVCQIDAREVMAAPNPYCAWVDFLFDSGVFGVTSNKKEDGQGGMRGLRRRFEVKFEEMAKAEAKVNENENENENEEESSTIEGGGGGHSIVEYKTDAISGNTIATRKTTWLIWN
jgi:hypothetical protein